MTANPTLLSMPLAENGTKNVIPETQAAAGDGLFSQSTGFPAETSLPLGAGGVAPSREDFNGMANLLGGIAFMAQKGFTFNYDAGQDYYKGCVVIDPNDGNRYLCIADMTAGTVAPSADTAHDYWIFYPVGVINKRDVVITSGTYTAPVTGWYRITAKGGGGGGAGGDSDVNFGYGGASGGEGGTTIGYEYLDAGDSVSVIIGAGGTGWAGGSLGTSGGDSTVTVNANIYTGGGGKTPSSLMLGGVGGTGTISGASGLSREVSGSSFGIGMSGAGNGGGIAVQTGTPLAATTGGGGAGGTGTKNSTKYAGGDGGDGYVWFEYFDTSLNP